MQIRVGLIAVGVNWVPGVASLPKLQYAEKDAHDLAIALTGHLGPVHSQDARVLTGPQATRPGLAAEFGALSQRGLSHLIFSYSGHGEAGGMLMSDGRLSYDQLGDLLSSVKTLAKAVILDACFSGSVKDSQGKIHFSGRPDANWVRAIIKMQRGVRILASARSHQFAWEGSAELANGLFTYGLIQALQTLPGDLNSNRYLSLEAALQSTSRFVQARRPQQPEAHGVPLNDFPIADVHRQRGGGAMLLARADSSIVLCRLTNRHGLWTRVRLHPHHDGRRSALTQGLSATPVVAPPLLPPSDLWEVPIHTAGRPVSVVDAHQHVLAAWSPS